MRIVYKRSLSFIALLFFITVMIGILYLFYDKVIKDTIDVIVVDELSINCLNGKNIKMNSEYNFSITNDGNNDIYYNLGLDNYNNNDGDISFILSSNNSNVNISNGKVSLDDPILVKNILIAPGETQNFTLIIKSEENYVFNLDIVKVVDVEEYFYMTILNNNEIKSSPVTKVGEELALTNEGLIEDIDDDGISYYFRGKVDNNYVSFANLTWRIVRINGNGTVKLILDDITDDLINYNDDIDDYENWTNTSIYELLDTFYINNLNSYDSLIANNKYCIESVKYDSDNDIIYNAYNRIAINKIPTFSCLGDKITSKIGLLSIDEVIYAGALYDEDNTDFYLYNSSIETEWWVSTLAKADQNDFYPFLIDINGKVIDSISGKSFKGLRPTINLARQVKVTGDGSYANPYSIVN